MVAVAEVTADWTVRLENDTGGAGTWYRSRSGYPDAPVGTGQIAHDRWAPLGAPVTYYWRPEPTGPVQETQPVTLNPGRPVLSRTDGPGYLLVTVVSQPPMRWDGRSVAHPILGRLDPLVTVQKPVYHSATLRLLAADRTERDGIRRILSGGGPLILRAPCTEPVDDVTFITLTATETLVSPSRPAGPRWVDLDYQAVMDNPTAYTPVAEWTWTDLEAAHADWATVEQSYPTWTAVEAGP